MSPTWMQQSGSAPSQPRVQQGFPGVSTQVTGSAWPPKQRWMPFESKRQTCEPLPVPVWQQFCEAL